MILVVTILSLAQSHRWIGSSTDKKTSSFWSRHLSNGYSPSLPNSCMELSHSSEATKARWASESARWTWNILKAFLPTLLPGFRGSSTHMGSNLPDWNCCFFVFWMLNCRCNGATRCGCGEKGSRRCASWERKKYCLVRTLMPNEEREKMREK